MREIAIAVALLGCARPAIPQTGASDAAARSPGIQDNSFLVEEAYNQEPGVVQHIQQFLRDFRTGGWTYSFTQEWPVGGLTHQLSYTLAAARIVRDDGRDAGLGDLMLNYRYQLVGNGEAAVAVAPRLSMLLPTGSFRRELGLGAVGLQAEVPVSVVLSEAFVAHGNAGVLWVPRARDARGDRADLVVPNVGGSVIWRAAPTWNLLCEAVWSGNASVAASDRVERKSVVLIDPGARFAWNFRSGLQIVGGIGVPLGFGSGPRTRSVLLYLSFEHPFERVSSP